MINTVLAVKKGMVSGYDSRGRRVGATVLSVEPNFVTQIKTVEGKDKYNAVQIGAFTKKSVRKPQIGQAKKAGIDQKIRWFREIRVKDQEQLSDLSLGQEIKINQVVGKGDVVKITSTSKGKGFQGGVRRHGFAGGPKTHGQSDRHRAPGSSGSGTTPGRVYKGKRMAGHMGVDTVSYTGLEVLDVDRKNLLITIKGGVPGAMGALVIVEKQGKVKGYTPPPEEKDDEEENAEPAEKNAESAEVIETPTEDVTPVSEEAAPVEEVAAVEEEKGEENAN